MILIQSWQEAAKAAFAIRQKVFIEEQGVPEDLELDEFDPLATHALAFQKSECIGTGRLVPLKDKCGQIGRMAVLPDYRNTGVGRALLEQLIEHARSLGIQSLVLHSQVVAIPFYEKHGFRVQGDIYDEAGIPHRNMILLLPKLNSVQMPTTPTPYLHRVCYSDTDAAGFVYHGRYLEIFERSRAEWLYQHDLSPTKLVNEFGILLPVRELTMNFYKPGRLDDLLYIDQVIEHRGRTQVAVKQTASRMIHEGNADDLQIIASALLHIVCVDTTTLKPKAIPDWLFID